MNYVRDKRSPKPKSEGVSRVMRANRAKDSGPEVLLRKALWSNGLRGYRLHRVVRTGNGSDRVSSRRTPNSKHGAQTVRPDISYVGNKVAIFVHGCFGIDVRRADLCIANAALC